MKNMRDIILGATVTIAAVGQIVLAILLYNPDGNVAIINIGWGILWLSAIFGWLPIYTFRKWGGVPKGKGYVSTTVLVDRGVYAIVRHPQYLAGILVSVALPLISQHWAVALTGVVAAVTDYISMIYEDASAVEKFGEAYRDYMQRVPRANFLLGVVRLLQRKRSSNKGESIAKETDGG
jgi:protein-S-isoprenylcysteine O-methyltransferase Ste14